MTCNMPTAGAMAFLAYCLLTSHVPEVCSQQISGFAGVVIRSLVVLGEGRGATRPTHRCPFRASFFGRVCYFARRIVGELQ